MNLRNFLFNALGSKNVDRLRYWKFLRGIEKNKIYEEEIFLIPRILKNPKIILDIGANYGNYSIFLSKKYPRSRIFAFEPVTRTFNILEKVKEKFELKNVELIKEGLGSKENRNSIVLPNHYTITAHIMGYNYERKKEDEIEIIGITTLDNFTKEQKLSRIDFIKCDIEGFELEFLKGGKEAIKRFKPIIFMEIEERHTKKYNINSQEVINFLKKLGYSSYSLKGDQMKKRYKINKNFPLYLFIPKKKKNANKNKKSKT